MLEPFKSFQINDWLQSNEISAGVIDWLYEQTTGIVQSGPFKGMWIPREQAWADGALCPFLLGCHEQELHEILEMEIRRLAAMTSPKIVNLGCAEGYYAIGLARRLPHATVWAIDPNEQCLRIMGKAAAVNGVKIIAGGDIDEILTEPDLVFSDCESAETRYLDCQRFPAIKKSHFIVEVHNEEGIDRGKILFDRWNKTHHIVAVTEGSRNPNDYGVLVYSHSFIRWLAVCENRPCVMGYFIMVPKGDGE
jgi:hypothetical protein